MLGGRILGELIGLFAFMDHRHEKPVQRLAVLGAHNPHLRRAREIGADKPLNFHAEIHHGAVLFDDRDGMLIRVVFQPLDILRDRLAMKDISLQRDFVHIDIHLARREQHRQAIAAASGLEGFFHRRFHFWTIFGHEGRMAAMRKSEACKSKASDHHIT